MISDNNIYLADTYRQKTHVPEVHVLIVPVTVKRIQEVGSREKNR